MADISERIRHQASMAKIISADEAAQLFRDGMRIATSGSVMGYPKATLIALAERIKKEGGIKVDLLCTGPLSAEVEDGLTEAGGIRTRIGAIGSEKLRAAVNRGEVTFIEGKGSQLPQQVKRGWFGPIDILVIEAIGLTPEGNIIPSTAVYDTPEWIDAAREVIVEINLNRPLGLEGLHDVYRKGTDPIPLSLSDALKRIGVPYFSIDPKKIRAIVLSDRGDKASDEGKPDPKGDVIADHLIEFFHSEIDRKSVV
jgi:succinyl-CoA:acetate CoA-transferase